MATIITNAAPDQIPIIIIMALDLMTYLITFGLGQQKKIIIKQKKMKEKERVV